MARSRALLTPSEREALQEEGTQPHYEAVSRLRRRIEDELVDDIDLLAEHRPEVLNEIRKVICDE